MDFKDLLQYDLPTHTVEVGPFSIVLQALSAKAIDDLITKFPSEKDDEVFSEEMRANLVSQTVVDPKMTPDQVDDLFAAWSRPDVQVLMEAVFRLNWTGEEAEQVPLSGNGSDGTGDTP